MTKQPILSGAMALALGAASHCMATISVSVTSGTGTGAGSYSNHQTINLGTTDVVNEVVQFTILASSTDEVGDIVVTATCAGYVELVVAVSGCTSCSLTSIDSISRNSSSTSSVMLYSARASTIGPIDVTQVRFAQAGAFDAITASAASDGRADPSIISVVGTDFLGDIVAESGSITNLSAGGTLGTSLSPISIRAQSIDYIEAQEIHADISGPTGSEDTLELTRIAVTDGSFDGSVTMKKFVTGTLGEGIQVDGEDLNANLYIKEDVDITSGSPGNRPIIKVTSGVLSGTVVIGGKLKGATGSIDGTKPFDLPAYGLTGQIIINASDAYDPATS